MVANSPGSSGGFSNKSPSEGPTAGFDKFIGKKGVLDFRKVPPTYRDWLKNIKNK